MSAPLADPVQAPAAAGVRGRRTESSACGRPRGKHRVAGFDAASAGAYNPGQWLSAGLKAAHAAGAGALSAPAD